MGLFAQSRSLAAPPIPKHSTGAIIRPALIVSALALAMLLAGGAAYAAKGAPGGGGGGGGGGTAKPPTKGLTAPNPVATLPDPVFTDPKAIHGFDVTGFIQDMTVAVDATQAGCPKTTDPSRYGGTVQVNGVTIKVPCNTIIQMPANTLTWAEFVNGGRASPLGLVLNKFPAPYPSYEIHVIGNTVLRKAPPSTELDKVAWLIFVSQQSANSGQGYISRIDYVNGNIEVDSGDPLKPTIIQINDPFGRFGMAHTPDARFSVDDANPTIHAATGYPMCVPRSADGDPLCPQKNRPLAATATTTNNCRNFAQAGVPIPSSGDLTPPSVGQTYCSQYVMKEPTNAIIASATEPDATQQAPFEVGDFITYSGTLVKSNNGAADLISAHTIEANVGIYTQPGTKPSYLAIGEFGIGTADPSPTAVNGALQETQDRMFLETSTTDVRTPVDIYLVDVDASGKQTNRWVTPYEMTGECNPATLPLAANCLGFTGGITTQFSGAQPQRARLRATKAPLGLLSQPTRTLRVVARSMCTPDNIDACLVAASADNQKVANGLIPGQYLAPVFEFIFPENVMPGDPIVPNDFWHLPFLRNGEGAGVGPLEPTPW